MAALAPITVTDIADNLKHQLTFMDIVINEQRYPKLKPKHGFLAKLLSYNPYAVGLLTITAGRLTFADEHGHEFQSLGPTLITAAQVGIYHGITHGLGNGVRLETRLAANLELTTTAGTLHLLNDDIAVLPALLAWLNSFKIPVTDPLQLSQLPPDLDWQQVTPAQVAQWAASTSYAAFLKSLGARQRS